MPRQPVTRRAFLKLTAVAASAATFARLLPGKAVAAVRACLPVWGMEVPTLVPTVVGDDCAPPPATLTATSSPTASATATPTATPSPTVTATPSAPPSPAPWRSWLPWVTR